MKRPLQILILFLFVYVTFAFGKDLYTANKMSLTGATIEDIEQNYPFSQDVALLSAKYDLLDLSKGTIIKSQTSVTADTTTATETIDSTGSSAQPPSINQETQQDPQQLTQEGLSLGFFLMGTSDSQAVFWGIFNSKSHTLQGDVHFYNHPELRRVGIGTYLPISNDTGSFSVHFSDPANAQDPGLDWTGNYDTTQWSITNIQNTEINLTGRVFQAPY